MRSVVMRGWDREIINDLIETAKSFIEETGFPVTFDYQKAYDRLHMAFFDPDGDIIVALDGEGKVAGAVIVYAMADWQKEKFGYVEKFFVRKEYRGKGVGRLLAERMSEWFDAYDCSVSFVTSTANIGETRLFTNLMSKYGYKSVGPTLSRERQYEQICTKTNRAE